MKLAKYCQEFEARLGSIETSLLRFDAQALQFCQDEIGKILNQLLCWKITPEALDESDRRALSSFRKALAKIQARADQGSNLCLGWRQLCVTAGYTSQGKPQFVMTESSACYEG